VDRVETNGGQRSVRLGKGAGTQDLETFLATVASHAGWGR
jgi:hypothetical protein